MPGKSPSCPPSVLRPRASPFLLQTCYGNLISWLEREPKNLGKQSLWRLLFRQGSQKLSLQMKARVCPACDHVAQFEAFHLTDLLDSITEKEFLEAFNASQGICLPHLFLVEEKHSNHPNFPRLLQLQLGKSQSLRERLEEFIRKQDRRFQQEITADEAKAWRVAMEFLVGKPGVFNNEIRADPRPSNGVECRWKRRSKTLLGLTEWRWEI